MNRRSLLATTALLPVVALMPKARASGVVPAGLDTTILADANGALNAASAVVNQVNTLKSGSISADVVNGLSTAEALITNLSGSIPAAQGATTLETIDNYISDGLNALAAVLPTASVAFPALAPAIPIVDAAIALLPTIENYVNPLITSITTPTVAAVAPMNPIQTRMTPAQARAVLVTAGYRKQ
jgi:hypothetical protein